MRYRVVAIVRCDFAIIHGILFRFICEPRISRLRQGDSPPRSAASRRQSDARSYPGRSPTDDYIWHTSSYGEAAAPEPTPGNGSDGPRPAGLFARRSKAIALCVLTAGPWPHFCPFAIATPVMTRRVAVGAGAFLAGQTARPAGVTVRPGTPDRAGVSNCC